MKIFIDTSSLFKKYVEEPGSSQFESLLKKASEIVVAPIYWLEFNSAIQRRLQDGKLNLQETEWIRQEGKKDTAYFSQVRWNENLEVKAHQMILKYSLKTLDSIQLAAACLSDADLFIVSDKFLFEKAKKELNDVKYV